MSNRFEVSHAGLSGITSVIAGVSTGQRSFTEAALATTLQNGGDIRLVIRWLVYYLAGCLACAHWPDMSAARSSYLLSACEGVTGDVIRQLVRGVMEDKEDALDYAMREMPNHLESDLLLQLIAVTGSLVCVTSVQNADN